MEQAVKKLTNEEVMFEGLLTKLNNPSFIEKFAGNPEEAFKEAGLNITLGEFTDLLSKNQNLYNLIIEKVSMQIDVSQLAYATSSACK